MKNKLFNELQKASKEELIGIIEDIYSSSGNGDSISPMQYKLFQIIFKRRNNNNSKGVK